MTGYNDITFDNNDGMLPAFPKPHQSGGNTEQKSHPDVGPIRTVMWMFGSWREVKKLRKKR